MVSGNTTDRKQKELPEIQEVTRDPLFKSRTEKHLPSLNESMTRSMSLKDDHKFKEITSHSAKKVHFLEGE